MFKKSFEVVKSLKGSSEATKYIKKFSTSILIIAYEDAGTLLERIEQAAKNNVFKQVVNTDMLILELM